jgi:hypothetical protein
MIKVIMMGTKNRQIAIYDINMKHAAVLYCDKGHQNYSSVF